MKTFSFFTFKGGCGKTTLNLLLAAYLRYGKGKTVKLIDYEAPKHPIQNLREVDLEAARQPGTPLYNYLKTHPGPPPYQIECMGKEINTYSEKDVLTIANAVNEEIKKDFYEYLLLDFPAGFSRLTPVSCLASNHLLDGVYIPTSTEPQERLDSFNLAQHFLKVEQPCKIVWNRLRSKFIDDPSRIDPAVEELAAYGITCAGPRIRDFNKATEDSSVRCFVRNTLCWPDRYVEMYCPELVDLFEDVISFLGE